MLPESIGTKDVGAGGQLGREDTHRTVGRVVLMNEQIQTGIYERPGGGERRGAHIGGRLLVGNAVVDGQRNRRLARRS